MLDIKRIKESVDLFGIVSRYVPLKKSGKSFVGLCPFHKENTPSFYVHREEQFYKCFGCDAKGDVFNFMQQIEHLGFLEAAKKLADEAGIPYENRPFTPAEKKEWRRYQEDRKLIEFMALRDQLPLGKAQVEFERLCAEDKGYRSWHKTDMARADALCWAIVDMLRQAEERGPRHIVVQVRSCN